MAIHAGDWDSDYEEGERRPGNGSFNEHPPYFDQVRQGAAKLYRGLDLQRRVSEHPVAMLAAAWGIGFVLGGGLSTALARNALGFGVKAGLRLLVPLVAEKAWSMTRSVGNRASQNRDIAHD
jgi:hypothetical protein